MIRADRLCFFAMAIHAVACSSATHPLSGGEGDTGRLPVDSGALDAPALERIDAAPDAEPRDAGGPTDLGLAEAGTDGGCPHPVGDVVLTGTEIVTYTTTSGAVRVPAPRPVLEVLVYVPSSDCFAVYPVTTPTAGAFRAEGLPSGPYYVHRNDSLGLARYVITTSASLDFGYATWGRPGRDNASANLRLNLTGLTPIQSGDLLWILSSNVGFSIPFPFPPPIPLGATSLSDFNPFYFGPLIDSSKGDRMVMAQLSHKTSPAGVGYAALDRITTLPPFTLRAGLTTTVSAAFTEVPQDRTTTITWDVASYESAIVASFRLSNARSSCDVFAIPRDSLLVWVAASDALSGFQTQTAAMRYGDPFGGELGWFCGSSKSDYADASGARVLLFAGGAYASGTLTGSLVQVPPPLEAPAGVRIAGQSGLDDVHTGATPEVRWSTAAGGTLVSHTVTIFRVSGVSYGIADYVAVLSPDPSMMNVVVPPNVLEPGVSYVVVVSAGTEVNGVSLSSDFVSGLVAP